MSAAPGAHPGRLQASTGSVTARVPVTEPGISVCIVCHNEADRLGPCLDSVVGWADEVLMMDLESIDGSAELAASRGVRVVRRARVPIVELVRNEIADLARHEWIVPMDPDERVTPGLAAALRELSRRGDVDMVMIPFMNFDLGYPATHRMHRYDPKPRMYRKRAVRWPEQPNELPRVPSNRVFHLPRRDEVVMVHDRNRNIPEAVDRVLRYAPAEAQAMIDRGEVFTARRMVSALLGKARKQFVTGDALADGVPGLMRASILVAFHFYIWAAFWHMSGAARTPGDDRYLRRLRLLLRGAAAVCRTVAWPAAATRRLLQALGRRRQAGAAPQAS